MRQVPDLFMKRVEANGQWSLFCPNECPGLHDSWGEEFEARYAQYEAEGKARSTLPAQQMWFAILDSQIETGTPCAEELPNPSTPPPPAACALPRAACLQRGAPSTHRNRIVAAAFFP